MKNERKKDWKDFYWAIPLLTGIFVSEWFPVAAGILLVASVIIVIATISL